MPFVCIKRRLLQGARGKHEVAHEEREEAQEGQPPPETIRSPVVLSLSVLHAPLPHPVQPLVPRLRVVP